MAIVLAGHTAWADDEVIVVEDTPPLVAEPPSYGLAGDDIRRLPGANNDTLRAAEMMPGVARTPFSFGGLVLRGASPRDTGVYLDGIEVPLAFHFGGITSFVPAPFLADAQLVPGNFDASYGRAQGGIVALQTRDPRRDRWREGGEAGLMASSAFVEGPLLGGGMLAAVRGSYLDQVAGPFVTPDTPVPSYWDAQLMTSWGDARRGGKLSPLVFVSSDRVASEQLDVAATATFVRVGAPYLRQWGATTLHVVPWLGWTNVAFHTGGSKFADEGVPPTTLARPTATGGLRADVARATTRGELRAGLEASGGRSWRELEMLPRATTDWLDLAAWADATARVGRVAVQPGARVERYGLSRETVVDPRVAVRVRFTDRVTLHGALGRYHQPPTVADVDPAGGNPYLHASHVDQASLGFDARSGETTASITAYGATSRDRGVPVGFAPGFPPQPDLGGFGPSFQELLEKELGTSRFRANVGRARDVGVEVALRRRSGRWFGLLSYTLARAERTDGAAEPWHPYTLDHRHDLDAAGTVHLGRWLVGARVSVVSGAPYSPVDLVDGQPVPRPWAATLPTFAQLDVRVDRRWSRRWGELDAYLDLQNATNRRNLEGRPYDPMSGLQLEAAGLPVIPFVGVELAPR